MSIRSWRWPLVLGALAIASLIAPTANLPMKFRAALVVIVAILAVFKVVRAATHLGSKPMTREWLLPRLAFVICVSSSAIIVMRLFGRDALSAVVSAIMPVAPVGVGILVSTGLGVREGHRRHCPKCDYPCDDPEGTELERCPECGDFWRGRWVLGERRRRPMLLVVAACVAAVALATLVGTMTLRWIPTSLLVWSQRQVAGSNTTGSNKAWRELAQRTLTQPQIDALAEVAIAELAANSNVFHSDADWLMKQWQAGKIAPETFERAFRAMLNIEVRLDPAEGASSKRRIILRATTSRVIPGLQQALVIDRAIATSSSGIHSFDPRPCLYVFPNYVLPVARIEDVVALIPKELVEGDGSVELRVWLIVSNPRVDASSVDLESPTSPAGVWLRLPLTLIVDDAGQ
jgi:hypothetical protein